MFERHSRLSPYPDAFQRYLLRTLSLGAVREYFKRDENVGIRTVQDLPAVSIHQRQFRNLVERQLFTRELLEQVISFPHLRDDHRTMLQTIAALGPDYALKEHAFTDSGDPDKWARERGRRPILDPDAIAKAMRLPKRDVHRLLCQTRVILRDVFNRNGTLFMTH